MSARVSNPECEQHSCPCYLDGDTWRCAACDIDNLERRLASLAADLRALLARNAELVAALAQTVDVLARAHSTIDGLKQPALDCARAARALRSLWRG